MCLGFPARHVNGSHETVLTSRHLAIEGEHEQVVDGYPGSCMSLWIVK